MGGDTCCDIRGTRLNNISSLIYRYTQVVRVGIRHCELLIRNAEENALAEFVWSKKELIRLDTIFREKSGLGDGNEEPSPGFDPETITWTEIQKEFRVLR